MVIGFNGRNMLSIILEIKTIPVLDGIGTNASGLSLVTIGGVGVDLGVFLPIANNGWIISKAAPQYLPSFELNRWVTHRAEQLGFEFVLSMVKYRGYGGETAHWDYALESLTLMAGLAATTSNIDLYASIQPLTIHPAMAARMGATIDNISGGRFGLNIVSGWNKYEYSQMGLWPGDEFYNERYDYATEWVHIVRELWKYGRLTYHGKYFTLDDCLCQPTPERLSQPPIVCAGMSDRGLRFTVEQGNISFVAGDVSTVTALAKKGQEIAREYGKSLKTYAVYTVISADSDSKANDLYQSYIYGSDISGLEGILQAASNDKAGSTANNLLNNIFIVPPIVGSPSTIVDFLAALSDSVDGVLFTFPDFREGMDNFGTKILPLMMERGLRYQRTFTKEAE